MGVSNFEKRINLVNLIGSQIFSSYSNVKNLSFSCFHDLKKIFKKKISIYSYVKTKHFTKLHPNPLQIIWSNLNLDYMMLSQKFKTFWTHGSSNLDFQIFHFNFFKTSVVFLDNLFASVILNKERGYLISVLLFYYFSWI